MKATPNPHNFTGMIQNQLISLIPLYPEKGFCCNLAAKASCFYA
jgi:hypothetical protein